ncbi:MAG: DUF302 domain-containing protein [Gammaproteobacteria bacterium]|jgi:cytochrome c oxidase cbb3-type subunit 3|nr:DUF302 domain-containing protein [Gammaproteobacteria bacterium]
MPPACRPSQLLVCALFLTVTASPAVALQPTGADSPVIVYESTNTLEETVARVTQAAQGNNFRIVRRQTLDFGLVPARQESTRQAVLYFCDFGFLHEALKIERRIGLFLPCQVNVVQRGSRVFVITPNPKVLSRAFFDNPALDRLCDRLQESYTAIGTESTL